MENIKKVGECTYKDKVYTIWKDHLDPISFGILTDNGKDWDIFALGDEAYFQRFNKTPKEMIIFLNKGIEYYLKNPIENIKELCDKEWKDLFISEIDNQQFITEMIENNFIEREDFDINRYVILKLYCCIANTWYHVN